MGAVHDQFPISRGPRTSPTRCAGSRADPSAKVIAGGTNLIDLMKNGCRAAGAADRHLAPAAERGRGNGRRGLADRRARAEFRPRLSPAVEAALSVARERHSGRRVAAAAQHGVDRRQSAAAHALLLFLRHRDALQQARARQRLLRHRRPQPACTRSSARAMPASRRIRPTCAWRWPRSRRRCMSPGRRARARSPLPISTGCRADTPQRDTNSRADEIVTAVELPPRGFAANYTYLKIRDRLSYAFALVSVAAALELDGDTIKEARLALGGVAHKPWRDPSAEAALRGRTAQPRRHSRARPTLCCATPKAYGAQRLQDRSGAPRHRPRADAGGGGTPQSQSQQKDPLGSSAMTDLHRHCHLPRRRPRQGHRRGEICRRVQRRRPRLTPASSPRRSPKAASRASTRTRRCASQGVIEVLTHREPAAYGRATDAAYKDDVAPDGSPFRPLYDDRIRFSGQPIALVVAEEWEIARFAASLVRVDYRAGTARHRPAPPSATRPLQSKLPSTRQTTHSPRPSRAAMPHRRLPRPQCATAANILCPIEHHNPMELYASTAVYEADGKLTIYDKTQGVQNVQRYVCAARSSWSLTRCACSRPSSAAPSARGCARNIRWCSRRWRRAR